jgi:hypothetical protein
MSMLCRCTGVLILQSGELVIQHDQRKEEAEEEEENLQNRRDPRPATWRTDAKSLTLCIPLLSLSFLLLLLPVACQLGCRQTLLVLFDRRLGGDFERFDFLDGGLTTCDIRA